MNPTELLIEVLNYTVNKKTKDKIQERVNNNVCVCCGERPIFRDGNCTVCDRVVQSELSRRSKRQRLEYLTTLYRRGLRLRPYEIREYRRKESALRIG